MVSLSIKRVVSIFILRPHESPPPEQQHQQSQRNAYHVVLFHRCATMPTYPGHWAGISGSIEDDDANPLEAALRELQEETNLVELLSKYTDRGCEGGDENISCLRNCIKQGLHVDVSSDRSDGAFDGRIIRVYPFVLTLPACRLSDAAGEDASTNFSNVSNEVSSTMWLNLETKGTEHDEMKSLTIEDFLGLTEPCVPALKLAFHHATAGKFLNLPDDVRTWERDRANGAAFLARQAVALAAAHSGNAYGAESCDGQPSIAHSIAMLRPSMVPIVNVMNEFDRRMQTDPDSNGVGDYLRRSLDEEIGRCVDLGTDTILHYYSQWEINSPSATAFVVGTFSRSSTTKMILESILKKQGSSNKVKILCSRSTPGNEGELMAADFPGAKWLHDQEFRECLKHGHIDVVLVGADCIFHGGKGVVNKVGTESMAKCCKLGNIPIICCADTWKMWDDDYPPGLEDIFESFVSANLAHLLIPDSAPEARVDLLERGHGCWPHKNNSQEGKRDREVTEPL